MPATPSDYYDFLTNLANVVKGSADFRERLGTHHDASNFVDPAVVTEAEALKFIFGDDSGYFLAVTQGGVSANAFKTAYELMPFCEIGNESHTETKGTTCTETFDELDSQWNVALMDKARNADAAAIAADPLASMKDFYQLVGGMLENFKTNNANNDYPFTSIDVTTPRRTNPDHRDTAGDFWMAIFTFTVAEG